MTIIHAIIVAIVEGLTEFLPVSSTGHMILTSAALGLNNNEFLKTFEISIQIGAIMAIVLMYIGRFFRSFEIYKKLIVAFIPTALVGFLAYGFIKQYLFSPLIVSVSLILGGVILIIVDRQVTGKASRYDDLENVSIKNAFFIGLVQCISMIPGVSRAGATIVGGVYNGLNKRQATEFSFLLAVPTMFAATGYDLIKTPLHLTHAQLLLLLTGMAVAFIFAWIAVKLFLVIIQKSGFLYFGWYRIAIGLVFLALILTGII
jgi:undecaprenyl-diphosphatase